MTDKSANDRTPTMSSVAYRKERGLPPARRNVAGAPAPTRAAAKARKGEQHEAALVEALKLAGYSVLTFGEWLSCVETGTATPDDAVMQYPFGLTLNPPRKFVADVAFPLRRVLCELKGNAHAKGWKRVKTDIERERVATVAGYRVIPFTKDDVASGVAVESIKSALAQGAKSEE